MLGSNDYMGWERPVQEVHKHGVLENNYLLLPGAARPLKVHVVGWHQKENLSHFTTDPWIMATMLGVGKRDPWHELWRNWGYPPRIFPGSDVRQGECRAEERAQSDTQLFVPFLIRGVG